MSYLSDQTVIYQMDAKNKPVHSVSSGDRFKIQTQDCFANELRTPQDLIGEIDFERVNPATGPIYVEEAKPGQTLKVTIHDIQLSDQAITINLPGFGLLSHLTNEEKTFVMPIKGDQIFFDEQAYPLRKMIGVIGTAPKGEPVATGTPDRHGGNMDCTQVAPGHVLYLPVEVPGALLALGDLHAAMGDGEINGAGAEVAGVVDLTVEVIDNFPVTHPMIETNDQWMTIGSHEDMYLASQLATEQMVQFIQSHKPELSTEKVAAFLSVFGDLEVNQVVNANKSMRMVIPKTLLQN